MAYDPGLAQRVRDAVQHRHGITEKTMFGGIAFMYRGHMFVGISGDELMARIGPRGYDRALALKHVRPMDFTGRPMKGYVFVGAEGLAADSDLAGWIGRSIEFVSTLPPKAAR